MTRIDKSFPGVHALKGVELEVHPGEVLALLGENGAGKSTLIKVLGGAHRPDSGTIAIDGSVVEIGSPQESQRAGIGIIYQEFNLVPAMTVRENIFLGQEPGRVSFIPLRKERRRAQELFERIGVELDSEALVRDLTVAQQQVVEIAKALSLESRIIVMDEPSAALSPREVQGLFRIIEELKSQGIGIVYVSHRLDEIFAICNRVTVLRDGAYVATKPIGQLSRETLIELMVGRKLENEFPVRAGQPPPDAMAQGNVTGAGICSGLSVRGLVGRPKVRDVSFDVRRGEIVALTGLVGAGRTESARLIFGADKREAGTISLDGRELTIRSPRDAIAAGICLLTEDRKRQGLVLNRSVLENFGLPNLSRFSAGGMIQRQRERNAFQSYIDQLQIKVSSSNQRAGNLSGGNQQKVVLAKWLECDADVIIFDEPTRGIDVGAKYEIYLLMHRLVEQGKAILMISSELPEVLGMADRIIVLHEGRVTGEISDVKSATQESIMELAVK
ncbi:MAG: sugar ABC transporter ATP-binding protein [Planctomycetota bacterium]|nr:sugar ABC transporter ATP-binding protein [Planctomycetota bacterium]